MFSSSIKLTRKASRTSQANSRKTFSNCFASESYARTTIPPGKTFNEETTIEVDAPLWWVWAISILLASSNHPRYTHRLINTIFRCICKRFQARPITMKEMVRWAADIACMIFGRLKAFDHLLACSFWCSILKTRVLIEATNEKLFITHTSGCLT